MQVVQSAGTALPGEQLDAGKAPGHWLLARAGKRILRPGGRKLTGQMLDALGIGPSDAVVELAPGLGMTARETLARGPASYVAVERDQAAAASAAQWMTGPHASVRRGTAESTGLPDASATVVYGEAMLTMQPQETKRKIVDEAFRVLAPGGRYGIHELSLRPNELPAAPREEIVRALGGSIRVGARPLTVQEWHALLTSAGFVVTEVFGAPMHLLEPMRMIQDEGFGRACAIAFKIARDPIARRRIWAMRQTFRQYQQHLGAVALIATRPAEGVS